MFTYPSARQCFAITALLSVFVPRSATLSSLLTLCTRSLWDLTSSCIHKYATSMCFSFPIHCLWRMCSVAFASMANTGFFSYPKSLSNDTIPFDSDAPNAAAYSSASALLLAMIFCFRVCAFKACSPSITTPACHHSFWTFCLVVHQPDDVKTSTFPQICSHSLSCRTSILEGATFHRTSWWKFLRCNPCKAIETFYLSSGGICVIDNKILSHSESNSWISSVRRLIVNRSV